MSNTLTIAVNPEGIHTLHAPEQFETDGSFEVVLDNHGESAHVYLNLDAELSRAARLDATNYYVEHGETLTLSIPVPDGSAVDGEMTVATAYGSEKRLVPITIDPVTESDRSVTIARSLSSTASADPRPMRSQSNGSSSRSRSPVMRFDEGTVRRTFPAIVFGLLTLLLALSSLFVSGIPRFGLGLLAVFAGLLVARSLDLI